MSIDRAAAEVPRFPSGPLMARRIDAHGATLLDQRCMRATIDPSEDDVKDEARSRAPARHWQELPQAFEP